MGNKTLLVSNAFKRYAGIAGIILGMPSGILEGLGRTVAYEIDDFFAACQALILPFGLKNIHRFTRINEYGGTREFVKVKTPRYTDSSKRNEQTGEAKKISNGRKAISHFLIHTIFFPFTLVIINPIHRMFENSVKIYHFIIDRKISKEFPSLLQEMNEKMRTFKEKIKTIDTAETQVDVERTRGTLALAISSLEVAFQNAEEAFGMLFGEKRIYWLTQSNSICFELKEIKELDFNLVKYSEVDFWYFDKFNIDRLKEKLGKVIDQKEASLSVSGELASFKEAIQTFKQQIDLLLPQMDDAEKSVKAQMDIGIAVKKFWKKFNETSFLIGKLYSPEYEKFHKEFNKLCSHIVPNSGASEILQFCKETLHNADIKYFNHMLNCFTQCVTTGLDEAMQTLHIHCNADDEGLLCIKVDLLFLDKRVEDIVIAYKAIKSRLDNRMISDKYRAVYERFNEICSTLCAKLDIAPFKYPELCSREEYIQAGKLKFVKKLLPASKLEAKVQEPIAAEPQTISIE